MTKDEDIHIMECLGKSKVVVKNGKVVEVKNPKIKYCPLFLKHRNIQELNKDTIRKNIEYRIKDFGLFTENRIVESKEYIVDFGTSEIFMSGLEDKIIDSAVIVSDCAGTVITENPYLVQGLCGRISGIVKTSPIKKVIEKIKEKGGYILDENNATINQYLGVLKGIELGYKNIGVSIANLSESKRIKELEKIYNVNIITFGVHTTGYSKEDVLDSLPYLDLITICASKGVIDALKEYNGNIIQLGSSVPIVALSKNGKKLLLNRLLHLDKSFLITTKNKLPLLKDSSFHI